jgi:hypothetical protein
MLTVPWMKLHMPKDLACDFLGVFSRFEYALKAAGYARSRAGHAEPRWRGFGQAISDQFNAAATPELGAAVAYLLANPPLQQTYDVAKGLDWGAVPVPAGASQAESLIAYVRCVRNNLFHGGKFLPPPAGSPDRDFQLVSSSLIVLGALVAVDNQVHQAFSL